jgi:uncharacterized protein (TIGR03905 family)
MKIAYKPVGICAKEIQIDIEDGIIKDVEFAGGCPGNLLAIAELIRGKSVEETIKKLEGIKCGQKKTSCADQLAQALKTVGS